MESELFKLAIAEIESKTPAYSDNIDKLSNFKKLALRLDLEPFQVWAVYFGKHIDAIYNAIARAPDCPLDLSEGFESRLVDAAAYLSLGYDLYMEAKK